MSKGNIEHEVRFLEINEKEVIDKLVILGAKDCGNEIMKEVIFDNKELSLEKQNKFVRLRKDQFGIWLAYKHHQDFKIGGTVEVEFKVDDFDKAIILMELIGLVAVRTQEKRRHRFMLNNSEIDITEWPTVPTLLEIEADSEDTIKKTADMLGLDWNNTYYKDNKYVLEERYGIPFTSLKVFTFDKIE